MVVGQAELPQRYERENLIRLLRAWSDHHASLNQFPWRTVEVEHPFLLPLSDPDRCACGHARAVHHDYCKRCACPEFTPLYFSGKKDIRGKWFDPRVGKKKRCVVDHKSTGRLDKQFVDQYMLDSQMSGYIWSDLQEFGNCEIAFVNALEVNIVPNSERKCAVHKLPFSECGTEHIKYQVIGPIVRSRQQLDDWRSEALELAARFYRNLYVTPNEVRVPGRFNGSCTRCEFIRWCDADRTMKKLNKWFDRVQWEPWRDDRIDMPKGRVLVVDNSILKATAACDAQSRMRYGEHFTTKDQKLPLLAGTAIHKFLEVWFSERCFNNTPLRKSERRAVRAFNEIYEVDREAA